MYDYGSDALFEYVTGGSITFYLIVAVFLAAAYWKLFTKAGEPGWAILIPIYNIIVLLRIAGKPWWWIFMPLIGIIPIIGWIIATIFNVLVMQGISTNFGKDSAFTVGLVLLPMIFIPILAFGSAEYLANGNVQIVDGIEDLM